MLRDNEQDTIFLDAALESIEVHVDVSKRAEETLTFWKKQEPLFAELLETPQSPPYHCEGPTLREHLLLMLKTLHALASDTLILSRIEEFVREKGQESVWQEMTTLLKKEEAFFEVFCLCHDIAKQSLVWFDAPRGSKGYEEGFIEHMKGHAVDVDAAERLHSSTQYKQLFAQYAKEHPTSSSEELVVQFYQAYGIEVHYYGHERGIYIPVFSAMLGRIAEHYHLSETDTALLEVLIAHHLDPLQDFSAIRPESIKKYVEIARRYQRPASDILRCFQVCILLDTVCGSGQLAPHGVWHDPSVLVRFVQSEHTFAPKWRAERMAEQKRLQDRFFRNAFREVGLDGLSLLELFSMEPSPQFGKLLRRIQEQVIDGHELPRIRPDIDAELARRAANFYAKRFSL